MAATLRKVTIVSAASALVLFEAFMDVLETLPKAARIEHYLLQE